MDPSGITSSRKNISWKFWKSSRDKNERELLSEIKYYLMIITALLVLSFVGVMIFGISNWSNIAEIKKLIHDINHLDNLQPQKLNNALTNVYATVENTRKLSEFTTPLSERVFEGMNDTVTVNATRKIVENVAEMPKTQLTKLADAATEFIKESTQSMKDMNVTAAMEYMRTNKDFKSAVHTVKKIFGDFYVKATKFERVATKIAQDIQEL